jgi:AcrR family transcriptional regulator
MKTSHDPQPHRPDRRTNRTRKALADALVELIIEKGYEAVSVQDILDRANVGRSTFYTHFENKEELLFSGYSWMSDSFFAKSNEPDSFHGIDLLGLFRHAAANHRLAKAMLGKNSGELVINHIRDVLYLRIRKTMKQEPSTRLQKEIDLIAPALAAMLVGLLQAWLELGMPLKPEQMLILTRSLVETGSNKVGEF